MHFLICNTTIIHHSYTYTHQNERAMRVCATSAPWLSATSLTPRNQHVSSTSDLSRVRIHCCSPSDARSLSRGSHSSRRNAYCGKPKLQIKQSISMDLLRFLTLLYMPGRRRPFRCAKHHVIYYRLPAQLVLFLRPAAGGIYIHTLRGVVCVIKNRLAVRLVDVAAYEESWEHLCVCIYPSTNMQGWVVSVRR
jgi:hypothetical protein